MSAALSVWSNWLPTTRISINLIFEYFFSKICLENSFHSNLTTITGTLREDLCTFIIITRSILLRIRNILEEICRESQDTHIMFNNFFFENRAFYEIMWKIMVEPVRPQMTI
jgi:hypothetical protein